MIYTQPHVVRISGSGEPSLHPYFRKIMALLNVLKQGTVHIVFYTNGTLFERFSPQEIAQWNIDRIVVSVDGIDQMSYERIRSGGDYRRLRQGVLKFRNFRNQLFLQKPLIEVHHVIMQDETLRQLLHFRRQWFHQGVRVTFRYLGAEDCEATQESKKVPHNTHRDFSIQWNGNVPIEGEFAGSITSHTIYELWLRTLSL